jgi:predicted ribosome quality control (RQC) complex YloA/Tae2 family protein
MIVTPREPLQRYTIAETRIARPRFGGPLVFDMLTTAALADELSRHLIGGRIQKVLQLDADAIGLEVYAEHQRHFLVASASGRQPRLYLSTARLSADPSWVSPLLLLLRKYARGGQIVSIQQPPLERIIRLSIAKRFFMDKNRQPVEDADDEADEGEIVYVDLIAEIMGRRSNLILVDESGKMLDAIKRVTPDMSRVRPILPGRPYVAPPPQTKLDPRTVGSRQIAELVASDEREGDLASVLVTQLAGFSPQMAREVVFRATRDAQFRLDTGMSPDNEIALKLDVAIKSLLAPLTSGEWQPSIYREDERIVAYGATRLEQFAEECEEETLDSISRAIELAAAEESVAAPVRHAQRRARLVAEIGQAVERAATRLYSIEQEQERAKQVETWRQQGEAIYAHIHEIARGQTSLNADGLEIALDPTLSPSENAQAYFERYRKAQSATANLPELAEAARTELGYLQQLQTLAELAEGIDAIEATRAEWEEWRRPATEQHGGRGPKRPKRRQPIAYRTQRGDTIYTGQNGVENDAVTFDIAGPDDEWLHARGVPGGHVIVRWAGDEDDVVLQRAASLAAWYSSGRTSTSVEVDATKRRYVRKIKGTGPGMVTYRQERTLRVSPQSPEELGLESANRR